jgi:hypothetical protein
VVSAGGDSADASVDFLSWSPPVKDLNKRAIETSVSVTELAQFDLSPPASALSAKGSFDGYILSLLFLR